MARRLSAIMFTDLEGYTQLSQTDERAALRLLRDQDRLVRTVLPNHRGRKVKSMGDGLLFEFPDALDAVECGVDLQRHVAERNAQEGALPLPLRVGIHLGDVQRKGSDILGDTVNIASRVEPCAEPGGVCLSAQVYDQVRSKVPYRFEKVGSKSLKGIREPFEIYRVVLPWTLATAAPRATSLPRLAVLPFVNISPDPRDEYIADGLTEELITLLSQLRGLQVTARTSVVQYKGAPKPIDQVGMELGVTSILEGSVRKAGDQLRITVQLIDVGSQGHSWSGTYDRSLADIFAVQTEVAQRIADALKVQLQSDEETRLQVRPTVRTEAYLAYLKGRQLLARSLRAESLEAAKKLFELSISLDDRNAAAYCGLADTIHLMGTHSVPGSRTECDAKARPFVARALELNPNLAEAHSALGLILWDDLRWAEAEMEFEQAISLSPSNSWARYCYAGLLMEEAKVEQGLRELCVAEESDPLSARILLHHVYYLNYLGRWGEAENLIERLRQVDHAGESYYNALGWYHAYRSDFQRALASADRWDAIRPGESWALRVVAYTGTGEIERARELLRKREATPKWNELWCYAWLHGRMGEVEACFRLLDEAMDQRFVWFTTLRLDPPMEQIRKDPRFAEILRRAGLSDPENPARSPPVASSGHASSR